LAIASREEQTSDDAARIHLLIRIGRLVGISTDDRIQAKAEAAEYWDRRGCLLVASGYGGVLGA
jgi:hypothetical protein